MEAFTAGEIALIAFPFSDLTSTKLRPAVILAITSQSDCILCQITSRPYDEQAMILMDDDFSQNGLQHTSYARPGKLFTAHQNLLKTKVARLTTDGLYRLREQVIAAIRGEQHNTKT